MNNCDFVSHNRNMEKDIEKTIRKRNAILGGIISFVLLGITEVGPPCSSFGKANGETLEQLSNKPQMAIVIDDFGYDRCGVEEMLSLNCKLTCAVMPALEFTTEDANRAHELGHEVILHMPMEAYGNLPQSWYGPLYIKNNDTREEAYEKTKQALDMIPHVNGINIHMGTALSQNKTLMREVMKATKEKDLIFLDSRTIEGSICKEVASDVGCKFLERDVFLEINSASYWVATKRIEEAISICTDKGSCVVIGHIGAVGKSETARALKDNLSKIIDSGIEIVPLSSLYSGLKSTVN